LIAANQCEPIITVSPVLRSSYYYRARYYDSQSGRFLSEDPLQFGGDTPNFFAYVRNSPSIFVDPFGLESGATYHALWGDQTNPTPTPAAPAFDRHHFIYYGNWGGPGWTGGQWLPYEDLTLEQRAHLAPPIDAQDTCYQHHDVCYSNSRVRNKCTVHDSPTHEQDISRLRDEGSCDFQLAQCLQLINHSREKNLGSFFAEPLFSVFQLFAPK
jgi:hypothetical protein